MSVVIATHDMGDLVQDAVASVFEQDCGTIEAIVVDDGSTDDTRRQLHNYRERIHYLYQDHRGIGAARNAGMEIARGDWIVFLDADDTFLPGKLHAQTSLLGRERKVDVVHSGWISVDQNGIELTTHEPWNDTPRLTLREWLLWKPVFLGAMLIRRQCVLGVGGFATDLPQAEDVDLMLRLSLAGSRMRWLQQPTVTKRVHPRSVTHREREQAHSLAQVMDRFFRRPDIPKVVRRMEPEARFYTGVWSAWRLFHHNFRNDAARYLSDAVNQVNWSGQETAIRTLNEFQRHQSRMPTGGSSFSLGADEIRQALADKDRLSEHVAVALQWWEQVWQLLLDGDLAAAQRGMSDVARLDAATMVSLLQLSLRVSDEHVEPDELNALWASYAQSKPGSSTDRAYLVSTQLTLAARSFVDRRWRAALSALSAAARQTVSITALGAWLRFVRIAISSLARKPVQKA